MNKLDRRQFIKLASVAGGGALWSPQLKVVGDIIERVTGFNPTTPEGAPEVIPGVKFGMVIDLGRCIGCRRCMYACKRENNVPDTISPPYIWCLKLNPGQA
jgi:ferredoxin